MFGLWVSEFSWSLLNCGRVLRRVTQTRLSSVAFPREKSLVCPVSMNPCLCFPDASQARSLPFLLWLAADVSSPLLLVFSAVWYLTFAPDHPPAFALSVLASNPSALAVPRVAVLWKCASLSLQRGAYFLQVTSAWQFCTGMQHATSPFWSIPCSSSSCAVPCHRSKASSICRGEALHEFRSTQFPSPPSLHDGFQSIGNVNESVVWYVFSNFWKKLSDLCVSLPL